MAATLSIHIKSLGEIDYEVLRKVSDYFMSIPSFALEKVLRVLKEVGFVRLVEKGRRIETVIPNIPLFDDVYQKIGEFADSECTLNAHEQATMLLLGELYTAPGNKDAIRNKLGIENIVFERCIALGDRSGIVSSYKARGKNILISPFYFADNLESLADAAAKSGASAISSTLQKVKNNQGWPLSLVGTRKEIGGVKLSATEVALIQKLSTEGVIKPPTIKFGKAQESFIFTPRPGSGRLNAANREIYERAMALVAAVRKGQLLPGEYRIISPVRILEVFRDRGFIGSNSEAGLQYHNLVVLRVGRLSETTPGRWELHLIRTPENEASLTLAIQILRSGVLAGMEVNENARIALSKDETYIQSLISSSEMRRRTKQVEDPQAVFEFEQMITKLG
ncbi:hypothetical protein [Komagataeibacter europaeus]|uniref:hypothetical protein n=1 Tax=Komagataeibacter europaeus TaxID=33995 RepID=UPI000B578093|nr:hypothetical protein [Komagataeibacter europaeus]ARW18364.1 hypothetical protein S101446_03290 [Komagataeibacter europaeus]